MATYYVKNGGNDAADGLSDATAWETINKVNTTINAGDTVLFKRGSVWRETNALVGGTAIAYTYYGAYYSTGPKPLFLGSITKNEISDWTETAPGSNIWSSGNGSFPVDVANIIFNNEESCGIMILDATPTLDAQGKYWNDFVNDLILLYSVGNPALFYTNIECALSLEALSTSVSKHYITFQNLDWRYWGDFVREQGGNYVNFYDCDISYCGGADINNDYTARFGGALQCYSYDGNGNHDIRITRCRISQCYDDAITFQGYSGLYETYNLFAQYNIITDTEIPFNFFHRSVTGATTHHIYIENNTVIRAAGGWGHTQRPDPTIGHSLRIYNYTAGKSDIYIRNNIFYESANRLVRLYRLTDLDNIILDNNLYYSSGAVAFIEVVGGGVYNQTYNTLSDWQTITGQEVSGVSGDPLFVGGSPFIYSLESNSPAIDAGVDVGLTSDFIGTLVPYGSAPDIGAYEWFEVVYDFTNITLVNTPACYNAVDNTIVSRWVATECPINFTLLRRDWYITNSADVGGFLAISVYGTFSGNDGDVISVYDLTTNSMYTGTITDKSGDPILITDIPYVAGMDIKYLNDHTLYAGYYFEGRLTINGVVESLTVIASPDSFGYADLDVSGILRIKTSIGKVTNYLSLIQKDTNKSGQFTLEYRGCWYGSNEAWISEGSQTSPVSEVVWYYAECVRSEEQGCNLAEYVPTDLNDAPFLNQFDTPVYWYGLPFDLSFILPERTELSPTSDIIVTMKVYNSANVQIGADIVQTIDVDSLEGYVNSLNINSTLIDAGAAYFTVEIFSM